MYNNFARRIARTMFILLVVGFFASLHGIRVVYAQSSPIASSCITCHEDRYYLYDNGRAYCVTEAQERCINCHAGDPGALDEPGAHTGLIANPLGDGGQRCQTCHAQNTDSLIAQVAGLTGYHAQVETQPYVPQAYISGDPVAASPGAGAPQGLGWFAPAAIAVFLGWFKLVTHTSRA